MKATIDNKTYNTANDIRAWWETLYLTPKGNWFLHAGGGPLSRHAEESYSGTTWGNRIIQMTREQVLAWCAKHNAQEAIDEHFADLVEEA